LKVYREFDDVTSAGKLFYVGAAATGNVRSCGFQRFSAPVYRAI